MSTLSLFALATTSNAQSTLSTSISSTSSHTSGTLFSSANSHTTSISSISVSHIANAPTLSPTTPIPSSLQSSIPSVIPGSPATNGGNNPDPTEVETQHSNLVNLYFFFLLLAGVIAALLIWFVYRRQRRAAIARREDRRDALARDLTATGSAGATRGDSFGPIDNDRWRDRRRWLAGFAVVRSDADEAPPPYKKRPEDGGMVIDLASAGHAQDERKPPDYHEVHIAEDTEGSVTEGASTVAEGRSTRRTSGDTALERP